MKNAIILGGVSRALHVADTRAAHAAPAAHATAVPAAAAQRKRRTADTTAASVDGGTI